MVIKLGTKKPAPAQAQSPEQANSPQTGTTAPKATVATNPSAHQQQTKKPALAFLKRGHEAQVIAAQEEAKVELLKSNVRRFWIPKNKTTQVTFLDGDLKDGMLDVPFFHQHTVFMNGSHNNWFICTADSEPCPVCEGGGQAEYVCALTVIDHGEFTSKKDGKVFKDQVRLYVAKRNTVKMLLKKALKQGGLTGCTFDVSRLGGEKSPGVGDDYEFEQKRTLAQLQQAYGTKENVIKPLNMDEVLGAMYLTAKDLRKLGFGSIMAPPIGSEAAPEDSFDEIPF